jgi:hypothetical protein
MSRADLVMDLKASLRDAADTFVAPLDDDFLRHLDKAAADMHRVRPRTLVGEVALEAGLGEYNAPADMVRFKSAIWGMRGADFPNPWDKSWPGPLPRCRSIDDGMISLCPAPTAHQIATLGSAYRFYYVARDAIGEAAENTTIHPVDRDLLLLRAQAEAMLELSLRDSVRPVQIGGGFGQQAKTGTPAALYTQLMAEWQYRGRA